MRICIVESDRPEAAFDARHGSFADMFRRWLAPALPEAEFSTLHVAGGEALPDDPLAHDGYLLTGSRAGVYDALDWMVPLTAFLHRTREARVPVAGVCFGHQIMAAAYGGRVEKSGRGWVIGQHDHAPTEDGRAVFGTAPLSLISFHQDQVVAVPPGARVTMANALSPHGGLVYPFPAISVQFHPEMLPIHGTEVLDGPEGAGIPEGTATQARTSLAGEPLAGAQIAQAFARFYRGNLHRDGGRG